jgi:lysophospholipase L1-like esterase
MATRRAGCSSTAWTSARPGGWRGPWSRSATRSPIARAHERGLRILGATITPFGGSIIDSATAEQTRDAVNQWIVTSHAFDGVIDFAAAVADPSNPEILNPAYNSGDSLHPNDAGCQAMANAINLAMLLR